jgi:hypothetical protein
VRIYFFEYFDLVRRGDLGIPMAVVLGIAPFAATGAGLWLMCRLLPRFRELGVPWIVGIGILAALAGFVLTHVAYVCSSCQPYDAGCWVEVVGWPMRQEIRDIDPRPVVLFDFCRVAYHQSTGALAVNFAIAALGIPLMVALLQSRRAVRAARTQG